MNETANRCQGEYGSYGDFLAWPASTLALQVQQVATGLGAVTSLDPNTSRPGRNSAGLKLQQLFIHARDQFRRLVCVFLFFALTVDKEGVKIMQFDTHTHTRARAMFSGLIREGQCCDYLMASQTAVGLENSI